MLGYHVSIVSLKVCMVDEKSNDRFELCTPNIHTHIQPPAIPPIPNAYDLFTHAGSTQSMYDLSQTPINSISPLPIPSHSHAHVHVHVHARRAGP